VVVVMVVKVVARYQDAVYQSITCLQANPKPTSVTITKYLLRSPSTKKSAHFGLKHKLFDDGSEL
jgi:hypothetical protein